MWLFILEFVTNIYFNKWWAGGNIMLVMKSVYIVVQTFNIIPVLYEVDFIIRHTKF